MVANTRRRSRAPEDPNNVSAKPQRDPRFENLLDPNSSDEIVISMDIGYTKVSTCWDVVNGGETVRLDSITNVRYPAGNNFSGRFPAIAVMFENDIVPAIDEKPYILEFNDAADDRIKNKLAQARHVFYSLKQCLIPEDDSLLAPLSQSSSWYTRPLQRNKGLLEKIGSSGKVKIVDVFTEEATLREFSSIHDILVELLRYQLQVAKKEIWLKSGLARDEVNWVMANRTRIGVSATTAFADPALDKLRFLLGEAGFPDQTTILSEAKSAATYSVILLEERSKTLSHWPGDTIELRNRIFLVIDIGGGTADVSVVKVLSTTPSLKLREVQPVAACMNGSEALNDIAVSHVRQRFGHHWASVVLNTRREEESLLENIRAQFGKVKHDFDPLDDEVKIFPIFPVEIERNLRSKCNNSYNLAFTVQEVEDIFQMWLSDIISLVKQQLSLLEADVEAADVPIILTGLGSTPSFIEQHLRAMTGNTVFTINPTACSSVAFGGYLSMLGSGLAQRNIARFSYGIIGQRNTAQDDGRGQVSIGKPVQIANAGSPHLTEEPIWLIKKGDDLSSNNVLIYDGTLQIENPTFPLHIVQRIIKSPDATIHERRFLNLEAEIDRGTIIEEDTLELVVNQVVSGLQRETRSDGTSFITTQFKVEITFKNLQCKVALLVPKFGRFTTRYWREKKTLMAHECHIQDVWLHTAQRND